MISRKRKKTHKRVLIFNNDWDSDDSSDSDYEPELEPVMKV